MFHTEIHIKGKLDAHWSDWFEGLQIRSDSAGDSNLFGDLPDRSAVYGVVSRLGILGITLISVTCREETKTEVVDECTGIHPGIHPPVDYYPS